MSIVYLRADKTPMPCINADALSCAWPLTANEAGGSGGNDEDAGARRAATIAAKNAKARIVDSFGAAEPSVELSSSSGSCVSERGEAGGGERKSYPNLMKLRADP